jgi:hypothetical protein
MQSARLRDDRFQRFSLICVRLGEGRLAGLNGSGFGRTDSAKQLEGRNNDGNP